MKTSKIISIAAAILVVVLGSSHADAGLFGCCGKDRCPPPPKVEVCLMICSPCDGCPVPVTLCVPECCVCEEPDVLLVGEHADQNLQELLDVLVADRVFDSR